MGIFQKGSHFFILPKAFLKKGIYGWMIFHFFEDEDKNGGVTDISVFT